MPITGGRLSVSMSRFSTLIKGSFYYSIVCNINPCNKGYGWYGPNSFKVSVINCVTPAINNAKINSLY